MANERGEYRAIARVLLDGKDYQKLTERARHVFLALKISMGPAGIEVQYPAALEAQLAAQCGIPAPAIRRALDELEAGRWIERDGNLVWIIDQLRFDPHMQPSNWKHRTAVQRHIEGLPRLPIVDRFAAHYADFFKAPDSQPVTETNSDGIPTDRLSNTNRITTTNTTTTTDNNDNDKTVLDDGAFERFWSLYPKRAGSNPKKRALAAWTARIREGVGVDEIMSGLVRYATFLKATSKVGTEYVLQAATFVGPDRRWEEEWAVPPQPARNGKSADQKLIEHRNHLEGIDLAASIGGFQA